MLASGHYVCMHTQAPPTLVWTWIHAWHTYTSVKKDMEDNRFLHLFSAFALIAGVFYYFKCLFKEAHNNDVNQHFFNVYEMLHYAVRTQMLTLKGKTVFL